MMANSGRIYVFLGRLFFAVGELLARDIGAEILRG